MAVWFITVNLDFIARDLDELRLSFTMGQLNSSIGPAEAVDLIIFHLLLL